MFETYLDRDPLLRAVHTEVGVKRRYLVNAALIRHRERRPILVSKVHDGVVEGLVCRYAHNLLWKPNRLPHERDVMRSQAAQEPTHLLLLLGNLLPRERLLKQLLKPLVALLRRRCREVCALDLEGAALVHELGVGAAEVADARVEDPLDGGYLALESVEVARGIAAHVPHEDAGAVLGSLLGV